MGGPSDMSSEPALNSSSQASASLGPHGSRVPSPDAAWKTGGVRSSSAAAPTGGAATAGKHFSHGTSTPSHPPSPGSVYSHYQSSYGVVAPASPHIDQPLSLAPPAIGIGIGIGIGHGSSSSAAMAAPSPAARVYSHHLGYSSSQPNDEGESQADSVDGSGAARRAAKVNVRQANPTRLSLDSSGRSADEVSIATPSGTRSPPMVRQIYRDERPRSNSSGPSGPVQRGPSSADIADPHHSAPSGVVSPSSAVFVERAHRLQDALASGSLAAYTAERAESLLAASPPSSTPSDEALVWSVLSTHFLPKEVGRAHLVRLLGFSKDEVRSKINAMVEAHRTGRAGKSAAQGGTVAASAPSPSISASTPRTSTGGSFRLLVPPTAFEADQLLTLALVLGDFESAASLCLATNRHADALLLAAAETRVHRRGTELLERTQLAYLEEQQRQRQQQQQHGEEHLMAFDRLLRAIVCHDLRDIVQNAELGPEWRAVGVVVCSLAEPEEMSGLMGLLGARLEEQHAEQISVEQSGRSSTGPAMAGRELRRDAMLCYLVAGMLEKVAQLWVAEMEHDLAAAASASMRSPCRPSSEDALVRRDAIQALIEKAIILQHAVGYIDPNLHAQPTTSSSKSKRTFRLAPLYDCVLQHVEDLTAHRLLVPALTLINQVPADYRHSTAAKDNSIVPQSAGDVRYRLLQSVRQAGLNPAAVPSAAPLPPPPPASASSLYGPAYAPYGLPTHAHPPHHHPHLHPHAHAHHLTPSYGVHEQGVPFHPYGQLPLAGFGAPDSADEGGPHTYRGSSGSAHAAPPAALAYRHAPSAPPPPSPAPPLPLPSSARTPQGSRPGSP
ncbi:protein transport protein S31 [Tilletia horrida]|nr:protein transport protein S31 [Tilletia horrida]